MAKISKENKIMSLILKKLKTQLISKNLDGYIVPKNDQFFSEYAYPNRLKIISNFSGSAGFAVILRKKNYLFVDGRYTTQAKIESGRKYNIFEIPKLYPFDIFKKYKKKIKIGFDPSLFTNLMLKRYFNETCNLIPIKENLIDNIYKHKKKQKSTNFYFLNKKIVGESLNNKIIRLKKFLKNNKIDNIFISAPENVAWLLNLRGKDNPNSPIPNSTLIVTKKGKIFMFSDLSKINKIKNYKKITFNDFDKFFLILNKLNGKKFSIDRLTCSIANQNLISSRFNIINSIDPCYKFKSIKNKIEINNMKKAHIADGVALTKFLFWLKKNKFKSIDEIKVEKKLENFRKKNTNYLYPSFSTIAGSGPNGAIIHYRANSKSNRIIGKNDLLLCDSGGQYKYGTTDVTRTICFNKPNNKIKDIFTRVLKGHIAVATNDLNKNNKGYQIDKQARYWLNKIGLDYGHGTGHGVGFFLNVHEGPQSISKFNEIKIKEGMILSNEPGYYKENKFGIRIENLIYVQKSKKKLCFKNLTYAPIDKDLIDFKILNKKEKNYLFKYHMDTYMNLSNYLNLEEKKWLQDLI